ncbi:isopentenyl-diphosphate delta-isomerase I [Micromonas commoda]|uniref:isopentenyl-diphosphate Delta-isomerase n=1 Tax=Micromonas commoda (strain RCC299 / NOUM17 / CCMP2709) TaxID=296587 RepID=C1EGE8_MICCC|nr:isopentenyl-diphosphate delta-isomerase I [Micromonas commoda]ACO66764.1 isopentenyl-diphosphate delta-isomerase I [Micromonas commoda]|eukprot:XP_002505506.1 isopentenyl-diphosphate delta-isomerase I [Micromonas commoda]
MLGAAARGLVARTLHSRAASSRANPPFAKRLTGRNSMATAAWDGSGTQEDLMYRDECILVDERDNIVGHDSKYASHRFISEQPRGLLHRAFSVFLFSADDKLLLQQRASTKITFPSLWTNTCCSHPLYGYEPTEVDTPEGIADGSVLGAKRAAVRKLKHELGIQPESVPLDQFRYLTRLHYCAADEFAENQSVSGGPWGEHEMDYILFIKPRKPVTIAPNPEEIDATRWVTREELREMMADPALRWSPWFRIICDRFLDKWWLNLDETIGTDKHVDLGTIHEVM